MAADRRQPSRRARRYHGPAMKHVVALYRPKMGGKPTRHLWVRFTYKRHVYRHSTYTRVEAAARRRGEVWRLRVVAFVEQHGRVPRDADVEMPTSPEETPEIMQIEPSAGDGSVRLRLRPGPAAQLAAAVA